MEKIVLQYISSKRNKKLFLLLFNTNTSTTTS